MRASIIYVKENGELKLTKEELEKLLDDAYNKGYSDGCASKTVYYSNQCWNCPYKYHGITLTSNESSGVGHTIEMAKDVTNKSKVYYSGGSVEK